MRVFLDANVIFTAAHNPHGNCAFLFELATLTPFELLTCEFALREATLNLELKFPAALKALQQIERKLKMVPTLLEGPFPTGLPEKDQPIFLSAKLGRCSHLLTGDLHHFGKWMNHPEKTQGLLIQTVADFYRNFHRIATLRR